MNTNRLSQLAIAALAGLGIVAAVSPSAQAQPPAPTAGRMAPPAGGRPMMGRMDPAQIAKMKAMRDKMIADLHLTPDQKARYQKQTMENQKQMMALRADKTLPEDQKKTKYMAMMMANRAKTNAIFTPAQLAKIKESQKAMMQQMKMQAPPPAPAKH